MSYLFNRQARARVSFLITALVILFQITLPLGALMAAIQPTPQMAQSIAQQAGLGEWIANAVGQAATWAQPLWGQPKTAAAQTSAPGGVSTNLHFWYSADVGASSSQWNDRSSNGYNVTQATSANQPALTGLSNFNPAFVFDGVNDVLTNSAFAYTSDDEEYFAVVLPTTNAGTHNIVGMGKLAFADEASEFRFNANKLNYGVNQSIFFDQITAPTTSDGRWQLTNGNRTTALNGAIIRMDGAQVASGTIDNVASGLNYLNIGARRYRAVTDFFFEGQIAEVVLYSSQLSAADRNRVESYLALKHGVTLNQTTATNYVASDGTTKVWDATVNATYSNNIAGIGRDDTGGLNQKQSTSVNSGFQPVIGLGTIAATNAANSNTFAADKNYMVWGSSSAATNYGVSYTPTGFSPPGGYFRMARVWKVQETGTVGNVSVQGSGADHLLVSNDPTFATGVTELDLSSGSATFNFTNGQYFTFGANVTAPGGTSASLALWLKADAGTSSSTNGAAINLWADQTLLGNDAAQATGSLQPEYTANSGLFNFNPSVNFNPNARLQADISATAAWGSNDGTVYVIYNQETGTLTWRNLVDFGTSALDSNNPQFGMTPSNVIGSWDDNGSAQTDSTFAVVNGETRMAGYDFDNNVLGGQKFHFDGRVANAGALKKIGPSIGNFLNIGGDPQLGEHMLGQIAEVVVYQTQHDAATRQRVHSYLALKYGITLDITDNDGTIVEGDYMTTGGVKAWDKTANSSYHNDVAGIGRDDAEALYQKQSKSLATDDIITMGIGPVTTSNVANTGVFTSNLSYLVWGNNNASATTTTALNVATCAAPGQSDKRINRVWKVQETGALGKVYVQAALSAGFNANLGVYMMVSTDPTFATYTSVPMTKNGALYDTSYNFTSGDYFTFAGNTTAPATLCTDGNKYINWWNVGWGYGVKTKTVTQGSQTFTFSFTDASNVLYAPTFYPHQFWNRIYVPRYDNNPTAAVQFKMTMSKPALSVQFEVCDVDGWFGGKDVTTFTGYLGGSPVGNPKLSKAKSLFSGWGLTLPAANKAQGNNFWWDCWNPGRVFVDFNQPVDEIRIDYTKNNQYSFKQFNDIQIGSINVQCAAPPPPPTPDNIYVSKRAPQGSNLVNEPFTFAFELENLSCQNQTTSFADTLPAGLTYIGESLITPLSGTENVYSGTQSLALTNLIIPPGKSTLNIDAQGSAAGTYNNQASITVGGNSYLSDDPNQVGSANTTPVTLIASPFPTANLAVSKSASVATIGQNKTFTYTVQLTNNQATPVTVHFHDVLDGQMTYVAGSLVNPNGGTVQPYAGESVLDVYTMTLPVGLSTLHMQVNTNSTPYTNVVNVAEVTPQLGSGFLSNRVQSNAVNVLIASATTIEVNTIADNTTAGDGNCTLREAMTNANGNSDTTSGDCLAGSAVGTDSITFNIPGAGPHTIAPTSALPNVTGATTIDGSTQPGASCGPTRNLLIAISGASAGAGASGLNIAAAGFTIRGLAIHSFVQHGIFLNTNGAADNGVIECNHIGTDLTGTSDLGNAGIGIVFSPGTANNRIGTNADGTNDSAERNIISGNGQTGVSIAYVGTTGNVVAGNYIGTDVNGTAALGNTGSGIVLDVSATNNRIGTNGDGVNDAAERNIISSNAAHGLSIGSSGNLIAGNYIGTDVNGTVDLGNTQNGVNFAAGATNNRVGTDGNGTGDAAERNLISGNGTSGIALSGAGTMSNIVAGNYIGTDVNGTAALSNGANGILLQSGSGNNRIGTDGNGTADAAERNLISGNTGNGVQIVGASTNTVAGNYIGTDVSGTADLGNTGAGVQIESGAAANRVGTNGDGNGDAAERNLISGNNTSGVVLQTAGTTTNIVAGNYIGTNVTGLAALPNTVNGIVIAGGATNNRIGTNGDGNSDAEERNLISGNGGYGISISTSTNTVAGNYIGTNAAGTGVISNSYGVVISGGATNNIIGTNGDGNGDAAERNLISGNAQIGVVIQSAGTTNNVVAGNYIGTNVNGTAILANSRHGVSIQSASNNRIGTDGNGVGDTAERNLISGNTQHGVYLGGSGTTGNVVAGNYIGTDVNGTVALGNTNNGVQFQTSASNNRIGGTNAALGNIIAFNAAGVYGLVDAGSDNAVLGNSIFSNTGLGLDLSTGGVNANDAGDGDSGANDLLNHPQIRSIAGTIVNLYSDVPAGNYLLQIYDNPSGLDSSKYGEGETLVYSGTVAITAGGMNHSATLAAAPSNSGQRLAATLTEDLGSGNYGSTSEFSGPDPIANDDSRSAIVSSTGNVFNVVTNDRSGWYTDTLSVLSVGTPTGGTVTGFSGNNVTYTAPASPGTYTFTYVVKNTQNIVDTGLVTVTVTAAPIPNLLIGKRGPATATQGSNFSYTLVVTNTGTAATSGTVTVADTLPAGLSFVSGSGSGFTCSVAGQVVTCTSSTAIAINGTATITLAVNPPTTGAKANTATVIGGGDTSAATSNTVNTTVNAAPTSMIVNTTADNTTAGDSNCTLREAITNANNNNDTTSGDCAAGSAVGTDSITFNIPGAGPHTIAPTSALPALIGATSIDGSTQPSASCGPTRNLLIVLNGAAAGASANGLNLAATVNGFTIRGLVINGFTANGLFANGADNGVIECNNIGTNAAGTVAIPNTQQGVFIAAAAANNRIGTNGDGAGDAAERNLISGNGDSGVRIDGTNTDANVVAGNYIGTDVNGTALLGNEFGVVLQNGATNNRIGTDGNGVGDVAERNLIAGSRINGVLLQSSGTGGNVVAGNYIGTDVTGTAALGNVRHGISIANFPSNNRIGTDGNGIADAAEGNLISSNGGVGVVIQGASNNNIVAGNYIGTNAAGTAAMPNAVRGVLLQSSAANNRIGTNGDGVADAAERNLISGNGGTGVELTTSSTNNIVAGNYIGTDVNGTAAITNTGPGVWIASGAANNRIGTDGNGTGDAAERNLISGNNSNGVYILGASNNNIVAGNYIGTNAAGTAAIPNKQFGVDIINGASGNRVGTDGNGVGDADERNLISGNAYSGLAIQAANNNIVAGNYIGTNAAGTAALPNTGGHGIYIGFAATNNRIGTNGDGNNDAAERNLVSGNPASGVALSGVGTTGNVIAGNYLGTDVNGTAAIGNAQNGAIIEVGAANNRIGGNNSAQRNLIANNGIAGVRVFTDAGNDNAVLGNRILNNTGLGIDLGATGVTPNDVGDADTGGNDLLNRPIIRSVSGNTVNLYSDVPAGNYLLQIYDNPSGLDGSKYGEGETLVYSGTVAITAGGMNHSATLAAAPSNSGQRLAATLTEDLGSGTYGSTSEFSGPDSIATADSVTAVVNSTGNVFNVVANDTTFWYTDTLSVLSVGTPTGGTVTSFSGNNVTYTAPATPGSYTFSYVVKNTAGITATATATVLVTAPNLLIGKSGPATATQGTNFNYTLVVTNTGAAATSGIVTVADTLPAGLSFVSGSGGGFTCTTAAQVVTCTGSTAIAINGTATITLAVNPTTVGAKANTATVIGGGDTSAATSNTVNTTVSAPVSGIDYKLVYNNTTNRYEVWMRPTHTPTGINQTLTAQVTIKVPHVAGTGAFTPTNLLPYTSTLWTVDSVVRAPAEASGADYLSFGVGFPTNNLGAFGWQAGVERRVFSFTNGGVCSGAVTLMANNDPFNTLPNSLGTNPGNAIEVVALGTNPGNDYLSDYSSGAAICPAVSTLTVPVKLLLKGPYDSTSGLMRDQLRTQNLLPAVAPYTATVNPTATVAGGVFAVTGNNAIVDWVLVAVRNPTLPATVLASRAALLQRDGDVVALDGLSPLTFTLAAGNYHIAVQHRNHLGVMTAAPVALSANSALIDFTTSAGYGTNAQGAVGGLYALWMGDTDGDNHAIAAGPGNDRNGILGQVLAAPANTNHNANYIVTGYSAADVNLDGLVIAAGPSNDINLILYTIMVYPNNSTGAGNYVVQGRVP